MQSKEDIMQEYNAFIKEKMKGYEMTAKIIGQTIKRMQREDLISEDIQVSGRIKSFESAYNNLGKKSVDDCFGIRIIGKNDELEKIEEQIEQILIIKKVKDHRERTSTNYNAVHQMVYLNLTEISHMLSEKNESLKREKINLMNKYFPIVEIQYWDENTEEQWENGELSYAKYKHKDINEILKQYRTNPIVVYEALPDYYVISGQEMHLLNKQQTLYKMYPEIFYLDVQAISRKR